MSLFQRKRSGRAAYRPEIELLESRLAPANLLAGFTESIYAGNGAPLSRPTAMEFAPDGKLFIAEQAGTMEVWENGVRLQANFFSETPLSLSSAGERGLLGIAFDPNYDTNRFVYVYYTATSPSTHNRVSRFTANTEGDMAESGSETVILDLNNLSSATNHNGGAIHFGPDGKLYIATGENASPSKAQSFETLLGKILRINSDGTIPADNPFYLTATGQNRAIWALGLRNPYTFAFQPGTGQMYINDVGQQTWEEINEGAAGANYMWPSEEGPFAPDNPDERSPVYAYRHSQGCAITGGTFYNPTTNQFPSEFVGDYFFSDYCGGWIRYYDTTTGEVLELADGIDAPVDLRTGADGSLYYLARGEGRVYRIQYTLRDEPTVIAQPESQTVSEGESATFTVAATGLATLFYQWQRQVSGVWMNLDGETSTTLVVANVMSDDDGARFRVIVSNGAGSDASQTAELNVTINTAPVAKITSPRLNALYKAGSKYSFRGTGSDAEDGRLSASAFTWSISFYHRGEGDDDYHEHPFMPETPGISRGSFVVPNNEETATDVFYRIFLTVEDSGGRRTTTFRDIFPTVVTLTLQTNATGLEVLLDSQDEIGPLIITSVVGMKRTIEAPSTQSYLGIDYAFQSWSDRGAALHEIVTPRRNTTYTASYLAVASDWEYRINFQPDGRPVPAGYHADFGDIYGLRDGGLTYGWNVDNRTYARDRNSSRSNGDQRYDTLNYLNPSSTRNTAWEIELAPGDYYVHIVAGDPSSYSGYYAFDVEGQLAISADPTSSVRWFHSVVRVTVTAGNPLTISTALGGVRNRLAFVEIRSA